jgi:YidC/Oxa1 family membrane protein insertase
VQLWETLVKHPLAWLLQAIYNLVQGWPLVDQIGAFGVAIIVLTILIRLAMAPLQQFQLVTQRKTMVEQRKLAPEVGELRKKYKKDPQKLNAEMMKLYQEHGVNPLGGLVGCLPLIVQIPILTALYYVLTDFARSNHVAAHFLFIGNLNQSPMQHHWFSGIPIPSPEYLVFPVLAAITTLVQSRMLMMPPPVNPTDQEQQTAQMQRTMVWLSPLMIGYFALNVPAGLGLYWFIGNCVSIIQQSFVVGWGNVLPARFRRTVAGGSDARTGPAPKKGLQAGPRPNPNNGSKSSKRSKNRKNRKDEGRGELR